MFQLPDLRARVEAEGLAFAALGEGKAATGALAGEIRKLGELSGLSALRFTIQCAVKLASLVLDTAPDALYSAGIDLAVVDQNEPAGATAAGHLGIPFISVAAALPINREPATPPPFAMWPYYDSVWGRMRNRFGYAVADRLLAPINKVLNQRRLQWGLPLLKTPDDSFSTLAQISTMPESLDYPRRNLPESFHYTGPFTDYGRAPVPFPWERLTGKPLIYASFGTLQNGRREAFHAVAAACADLDVQLVLSSGGGVEIEAGTLRGSPIVVSYAPQLELLARSQLVITHGGLNTVLEALAAGTPMVAVPIANDQYGVCARVRRAKVGAVIQLNRLTPDALRSAIREVLDDKRCKEKVLAYRREIFEAGGVERAADIVEQAAYTGRPVLRRTDCRILHQSGESN